MTDETNYIGNLSTIFKTICMLIAGYAIGYAISIGLNLPISQEQLSEILFTILCAIGAYIDAKHPNTFNFLKNNTTPAEQQLVLKEIVLNEEYETNEDDKDGC